MPFLNKVSLDNSIVIVNSIPRRLKIFSLSVGNLSESVMATSSYRPSNLFIADISITVSGIDTVDSKAVISGKLVTPPVVKTVFKVDIAVETAVGTISLKSIVAVIVVNPSQPLRKEVVSTYI